LQRPEIRKAIKQHGLTMLGVSYLDFTAVPRMKPVTAGQLDRALDSGIATARANLAYSHTDVPVRGSSINISQGDVYVVADPGTFVVPTYTIGVGRFIGDLREKDGSVSPLCARSFYRRVLQKAASKGYTLQVGFEGEFHLVKREESRVVRTISTRTARKGSTSTTGSSRTWWPPSHRWGLRRPRRT
jgi:glutamine synthetase